MDSLRTLQPSVAAGPAEGADEAGLTAGTALLFWAVEVEHHRSCPGGEETRVVTPTGERP